MAGKFQNKTATRELAEFLIITAYDFVFVHLTREERIASWDQGKVQKVRENLFRKQAEARKVN